MPEFQSSSRRRHLCSGLNIQAVEPPLERVRGIGSNVLDDPDVRSS